MKFLTLLSFGLSASAIPTRGITGVQIRDESRLEKLRAEHDHVIKALNEGKFVEPRADGNDLEKRAFHIAGLGGMAIIEAVAAGTDILATLGSRLHDVFSYEQDRIWHNHGVCRTYFDTQGGGNCEVRTYDRGSADRTATHKDFNCPWIDPENNDPPVVYFEGDQGIGTYSVQYTATKEHAWDGLEGTEKCAAQGLCNPHYVFYRDGYSISLSTWKSQGTAAECQYTGDCKGLCSSGVKNQFSSGGVTWGGDCAIPCEDDGTLPDTETK